MELLCPVRDFKGLKAVLPYADSTYFGVKSFNMRAYAQNFEEKDLKGVMSTLHKENKKGYLTTNIVVYDEELQELAELLENAKASEVDAVICHDLAAINLAKKIGIPFHVSTQCNVSNSESAKFYSELGAEKIVLARELNLSQISAIASEYPVEVFVHGAMCVSISGRCFFSQYLKGKSANRGECTQICRREFTCTEEDGGEVIYDGQRFLSARDLCTIDFLDEVVATGASTFKIEGRMKDAVYAETTARVYHEALETIKNNEYSKEKGLKWKTELEKVFNRGFSSGFFYGPPVNEVELEEHGSKASHEKSFVGKVLNYFPRIGVAEVLIQSNKLKEGDEITIEGHTTFVHQNNESMEIDGKRVTSVGKGTSVGIKVNERVRENDEVYVIRSKQKL